MTNKKFRVWDNFQKCYLSDFLINSKGEVFQARFIDINQATFNMQQNLINIDAVLEQWTNETDSTIEKKEIFECDIIHIGDRNIRYVVGFRDGQWIAKQVGNNSIVGLWYWIKQVVVLGNIHENSELLEAKK